VIGVHLWAESYERALDDVFRLQDRLAHEIALRISLILKVDSPAPMSAALSVARDAYEAYLKGRYFWNKRTAQGTIRSIDCFREAIRREPSFAGAYAGLADAYVFQGLHGFITGIGQRPSPCFYAPLSSIRVTPWHGSSTPVLYRKSGVMTRAIKQISIARELDPLSTITLAFSGYIFYRAREYKFANEKIDQAIELEPDSPSAYWFHGLVREQQGEFEDAIHAFSEAVRLSMGQPLFVAALGHALGQADKKQEALSALDKLVQLSAARYVSPFEIAVIHIGLNDTNSAFEWLEKAYDQRVTRMRALGDPLFDHLRSDARFANLIGRVNLPA
jgi:tetratricopeptide (TPR) repeat protein